MRGISGFRNNRVAAPDKMGVGQANEERASVIMPKIGAREGSNITAFTLEGSRCERCGGLYFPPRDVCPECLDDGVIAPAPLSRHGTLYSFSIVHAAPKGFRGPYAIGYVDLPENVRVLAQIVDWEDVTLRSGMTMEVDYAVIGENPDGSAKESYVFRAADQDTRLGGN